MCGVAASKHDASESPMVVKADTNFLKVAAAIIGLALILRATWGAVVPVVPISDSRAYDILAHVLAEDGVYGWGKGSPTAYWPPGTSAMYAALYVFFGRGFGPAVVLNVILSTGIVALTIALSSSFFDRKTSMVAGVLMAIWPSEVAYVTVLASELPFTFLVLSGCTVWFAQGLSKWARAIASGLLFGAASYFRPIGLLLPIVLWLSDGLHWARLRAAFPVMLLSFVTVAIAIMPWAIRNEKSFGHFVLMSTSDGVNLWMGNNPDSTGRYLPMPVSVQGLSEYDQNKILSEDALLYISEHPAEFIARTFKKVALLHTTETIAITWNTGGIKQRFGEGAVFPLKLVTQGFWMVILLYALSGIGLLLCRHDVLPSLTNPVLLIWIYFTAVYSIFVAEDRYHFPSHPFISMLAAFAMVETIGFIKSLLSGQSGMRGLGSRDRRSGLAGRDFIRNE